MVELLVVISIIAILATLLLLQLGVARAKARDAKRIADINQVRSALELRFDDEGGYLDTNDMGALKPTYVINIPRDPLATGCTDTYDGSGVGGPAFCYGYATGGPATFHLWVELERKNRNALRSDTDIDSSGWATGAGRDHSNPAVTELCTDAANIDCTFDLAQP